MHTDRLAISRCDRSCPPVLRSRLTKLSLAVALAMPVVTPLAMTVAQEQPKDQSVVLLAAQDAATPQAKLAAASDQLKAGQYEEALTNLQSIDAASLSEAERQTLAGLIAQAEDASNRRRAARADFEKGQAALEAGNHGEAANLFSSVEANEYADAGTKAKAREQLAVAQASMTGAQTDNKAVYESAVADYKAGRLDEAKAKFTQLQEQGYSAPWFNQSPRKYLEEIERQQTPKSAAEEARAAYLTAREQYRKGDWIAARRNFDRAQELGYKPGWFEDAPSKYLAIMDKKEQADAQKAAREAIARREAEQAPVAVAAADNAATPAAEQGDIRNAAATPATPTENAGERNSPANDNTTAAAETDANTAGTGNAPTALAAQNDEAALREIANAERLRQEQRAVEAARLVESAQAAESAGRATEAANLYTRALELDPNNAQAQAGRERALGSAGVAPQPGNIAIEAENEIRARRDAIRFSFDRALAQAQMEIGQGDFDAAATSLRQAEVARNSDTSIFQPAELQAFDQRLAGTRVELERERTARAEEASRRLEREAAAAALAREQAQAEAEERAIAQLTEDARRFTELKRYNEALKTVNQILTIDPNNSYATGVQQILFDRASLQRQRETREKFDRELMNTFTSADEKRIPYSNVLEYPVDWPDLVARREQTVREERNVTAQDEAVSGLLEKSLPEIRFQDVAFEDVIDFLRDTTQANIFVNWRALELAGIDRTTPVSTRLRNVKFSKVLRTILDSVGGGGPSQLGYTVDEGVITISTNEDLARNVETRTYDIRDLIISIPDFDNAPSFSLTDQANGQNGGNNNGGGGGGGFGGGGLFGDSSNSEDEEDEGPTREELVEQITSLIRETIGVGTWQEDGGQVGSLRELGGQLIVTQTPELHRQIASLLEKLREQRSIQVMVEARFLTVQRNFLEDIGVDFDFYLNNDDNPYGAGQIPGVTPLVPGIDGPVTGFGPINVDNNTSAFTSAGGLGTGINGNLAGSFATPNLQTNITAFLDDFQASLLIRATQGNQSVTQLTAPRVTLFNGQRAYVLVARQIAYVSDLEPVVATRAIGFDPEVDVIQSGVVLDVNATVSADRKYVTLTLRPQLSRIISIQSFPVIGGTTGDDDDDDGGDDDDTGDDDEFTSGVGFIQQPEMEITEVATSVSVPDGGTLLLGGTTISGEIERESGVPVLSKIPFLKRAFTNRGYAKDESVLLILVKPTIIIQREVEQTNFPLLTSRPG